MQYHLKIVRKLYRDRIYSIINIGGMAIGGPLNGWFNNVHVKLSDGGTISEQVEQVAKIFEKHNPSDVFLCRMMDDEYRQHFEKEESMGAIVV